MDENLPNEVDDRPGTTRRGLLTQVATTGAVAGAAAALPALVQEKSERPWSTLGSDQVSVAEMFARYATNLRYEDLLAEARGQSGATTVEDRGHAESGSVD